MKVEYNTGEIIDAPYTYVTLTNLLTTAPITTDVPLDSTSVPVLSSDPVSTSVTNLKLYVSSGETMSGTEKVEAEIFGTNAEAIALYARSSAAVEPRFIGNMMKMQSSSKWSFNWYTNNTQNGSYYLFARAKTAAPTPLDSPSVPIKVFNEVAETVKTTESVTYEKEIVQATKSVATADGALAAIVVPEYVPADEGSAPVLQEAGIESSVSALLNDHQKEIDSLLLRLGTAKRANDAEAEKRVMKSVDDLAETIADAASEQTDADYDTVYKDVRTLLQTRIDAYLASIVTFNALLVERSRTNVLQDSDRDGVSDFDEVVIYKTDPYRADTDHDGYTDGAEIISGFDPLSAEAESVVAYESPKTSGAFREDLLSVDSIEPIQPEVAASSTATSSLTAVLIGRGLPNSFVTLYVFSTPVIVTVKTDADGAWRYRFDKELEDGEHNVYVGMTDNAGRIVAKSRPLTFIKEAQAITPVEATSIEALTAADREPSLVSEYILYAIVSISVVAIGLVLILLGIHLDAQRRRVDLVTSPV
jgi:hypothetical protein